MDVSHSHLYIDFLPTVPPVFTYTLLPFSGSQGTGRCEHLSLTGVTAQHQRTVPKRVIRYITQLSAGFGLAVSKRTTVWPSC